MIKKFYADVAYQQTHYRRAGNGAPVILLHASPMSSELMVPLMQTLGEQADIIAPDTPGYGQSDALPQEVLAATDDLRPYVDWLNGFIQSLGLEKVCLYGTATGAQIAIEFARACPDKLTGVVLDNAAHFEDDERAAITARYFPSIAPKADGSHLMDVWNVAQSLFKWFPWYEQNDAHRISDEEPPLLAVHATALAYLQAGENYDQAYRRAFNNENAERVKAIKVPVRVIRSNSSILKKYSDRFDNFEWSRHIQMRVCEGGVPERYQAIANSVAEFCD